MSGLILLVCASMFFIGAKMEKELVRSGYRPDRLVRSAHGAPKDRYAEPAVRDSRELSQEELLDFESVEEEAAETRRIQRQILEECRKVRQSPTWDGEECWIELADKGGGSSSNKA